MVVNRRDGDQRERHLELGTSWFQHRDEWAAMPADGGPDNWQRIDVEPDATRNDGKSTGEPGHKVDIVVPSQPIQPVALPEVTVSNIDLGDQDVSFDVDQIGVPVLVKVSYFPNWQVSGAEGPWRVGPNMMVVVPTSNHVRLHFERSTLDDVSYVLTLIGIGLLVFFRIHGDVRHRGDSPFDPVPAMALAGGPPPGDDATSAQQAPDDWPWLAESSDPSPPLDVGAADPTTPIAPPFDDTVGLARLPDANPPSGEDRSRSPESTDG